MYPGNIGNLILVFVLKKDARRKMMQILTDRSSHCDPIRAETHCWLLVLYLGEIGFQRNPVSIVVEPQTATTKMTIGSVQSARAFIKNCDSKLILLVKLAFPMEDQHC